MNQILMTNDKNGPQKEAVKPVVKFFVCVIIIVALIFIGEGVYNFYVSKSNKNNYIKPVLTMEKNGSAVVATLDSEVGINKLEYSWDDGSETVIKCEGRKKVEVDIEMPQGTHKLNLKVIDVEGNKTTYQPVEVSFTETDDTTKPTITIVKSDNKGKINIVVKEDRKLEYIIYQWEGSEEVKVLATVDTEKMLTEEIDVQKGTKKLTVTAIDETGNKEIVTNTIIGSTGPQIKVTLSQGNFVVKVTSENEITKIQYTLNEKEHTVENVPEGAKEFEFKVKLEDGPNYLKINAYEGELMTEYKCKKTR